MSGQRRQNGRLRDSGHRSNLQLRLTAVLVLARHHSGAEVEEALLAADPQEQILCIGEHKLAQVRRRWRLFRDD